MSIITDEKIKINITGGFTDNLRIYLLHTLIPNIKFHIKPTIYEAGQTNLNLLNFNFPGLKERLNITNNDIDYCSAIKYNKDLKTIPILITYKYFLVENYKDKLYDILLNPVIPYSLTCEKIINKINNNEFALLGIRWLYPFFPETFNYMSLLSFKNNLSQIENIIKNNKNIILMCDDYKFMNLFKVIFYDLITDHNIILLSKIDINNVHDLFKIADKCKCFASNGSTFYDLIKIVFFSNI